jgi:lipoyl(octanoyl) transferase
MANMEWRIIVEDELSGSWNMAVDQAILRSIEAGESGPVVRLYGWKKPTLSLGYSQKWERELNKEKIDSDALSVVRRFTGGRGVLHANELTYSVIAPISDDWRNTLSSTYDFVATCLFDALQSQGFPVQIERGDHTEGFSKIGASKPCFSSSSRSEILLNDKKLIGSAQRRTKSAFLQHGSILVGKEHLNITKYLNLNTEEENQHLESLKKSSSYLQENSNQIIDFVQLKKSFVDAFAKHIPTIQTGELTTQEVKRAEELESSCRIF